MIKMKTLFVFNHPAPYKVHVYNELARIAEIQVIFERTKAKDRPDSFYNVNQYNFSVIFLKRGSFFGIEIGKIFFRFVHFRRHKLETYRIKRPFMGNAAG